MEGRAAQEAEIRRKALPFSGMPPSEGSIASLIGHLAHRRVVMLGEASHGTSEFYSLRAQITSRLVVDHGFTFVAAEADWPTADLVRSAIRTEDHPDETLIRASRWPTWMWANDEISRLVMALRVPRTPFYGLDVYSLFESIDRVLEITRARDPFLARRLEQRYACFAPYHRDEIAYAKSLLKYPTGCSDEILESLVDVIRLRLDSVDPESQDLFDAEQSAHIVVSAERFYRAMVHGDEQSWNYRDLHMLETLQRLLLKHGTQAKCIVWAHNSHVGDYRATDMVANGYVNLGGLARETFGSREVALVGFGTFSGQVTAARAWDGEERIMDVPAALDDSIESLMHKVADEISAPAFALIFGDEDRLGPLSEVRGHRAIGVVYHPTFETSANYVPTSLSNRYDAFVFVDRTSALESLHASAARRGRFPEAWPVGA